MVAPPGGNRSVGYLIGFGLIPSGFHGSFAKSFPTQPMGYQISTSLVLSGFCGSLVARLTILQISAYNFDICVCVCVCLCVVY